MILCPNPENQPLWDSRPVLFRWRGSQRFIVHASLRSQERVNIRN